MIGIYYIRHPCGVFYIGRTSNFRQRRNNHISNLRRNIHDASLLQEAYNAQPELEWEFIQTLSVEDSVKLEMLHIKMHSGNPNLANQLGNGYTLSEDHRAAITKAQTGTKQSQVTRARRSESMKLVPRTAEWEERRLNALRSTDKLKAPRPDRRKAISVDGKIYHGVQTTADTFKIDPSTVLARIKSTDVKFANWFFV